jgi:hypothetical protein
VLLVVLSCTSKQDNTTIDSKPIGERSSSTSIIPVDTTSAVSDSQKQVYEKNINYFHHHPLVFQIERDIYSQLQKRYGQPDSIITDTVDFEHQPDQYDSLYTVFYPGLKAVLFHSTNIHYYLLLTLEVSSNAYALWDTNLCIGKSKSSIITLFGPPRKHEQDSSRYEAEVGEFIFYYKHEMITKVSISYYID